MKAEAEKQPQIERKEHKWISWENLEKVLKGIPSPLRDRVIEDLQDDIKIGSITKDQIDADMLLEEVVRRVFGFSLRDLSPDEKREIEEIKNSLEMSMESESTS